MPKDGGPPQSFSLLSRVYECRCGRAIFFRNSVCLNCGSPLGYEPKLGSVLPLVPGKGPETWRLAHETRTEAIEYCRCVNLNTAGGCNWLVEQQGSPVQPFCRSCRLNRVIPDLSIVENQVLWGRIEVAKRRVISSLIALDLPAASRVSEDPDRGLAFDILRTPAGQDRIMTGHKDGLITLNIEEADDVRREQIRTALHEPYRTLVGHFRHEIGHYYWYRLVSDSIWLDGWRALFGDERVDYAAALAHHYQHGPQPNWPVNYISAYASIHPWEDWAETWAHYMHMLDSLGTAMSFGLSSETVAMPFDPFTPDALYKGDPEESSGFLIFLNSWLKLTAVLNELSRSMGQPDFYPFALPRTAVAKLHFVHTLINSLNKPADDGC